MPESNNNGSIDNLKFVPPQNLEAEQFVLGAILLDPKATLTVARIKADEFYAEKHGKIYTSMQRVHESGADVDMITVGAELEKTGNLEKCGGRYYLSELLSLVPTAINFKSHEDLVRRAAMLRRIDVACAEARGKVYSLQEPEQIITECINSLNDVRTQRGNIKVVSYKELAHIGINAIERNYDAYCSGKLTGVPSGFRGIDRLTNGFQKGWVYVIAGRTGNGKTSLAMQMAAGAASAGNIPGIISLEMDPEQLALREISRESGVNLYNLISGCLLDDNWGHLANGAGVVGSRTGYQVYSAFDCDEVESAMNILVQMYGVDIIIVDYLQLMSVKDHTGTREQEVSKISRMHKRKAKELHVPVLPLAQLNRSIDSRIDKKPNLSDLRESGAIEQDADVVGFIYLHECKCLADCMCGNRYKATYSQRKGRMNGVGDVDLKWNGKTASFRDVD